VKRSLARAAVFTAALVMLADSGVASANPWDAYAGQTYAKVSESTKGRAVIASRVGSYLPTDKCIVTASRRTSFLDSSGNGSTTFLVDLNCNDPMTAGHPGYSGASAQGEKAQKYKNAAAAWSKDFITKTEKGQEPYCARETRNCQVVCEETGMCAPELEKFLGL
jgi:hypothetical protein